MISSAFGDFMHNTGYQLAVYWGQDSAGALNLNLEKKILDFCQNYEYDIIPIAFLNIFFDNTNKDNFPGINLANHCNKTFKSYNTLLNCADIGLQIQQCQQMGKKILISLGGAAGLYYFTSTSQAKEFAQTIWNLFLNGNSDVRPFHNAVLDGVDLDIEGGTTNYYADFVKTIRSLMSNTLKTYYITGAPQCPFPDVIMGPGSSEKVLEVVPQEFDYLFVQFYNNYCSLNNQGPFNNSAYSWFNFAKETHLKYGKGPLIFMGLPAHPRAGRGYQNPDVVESAFNHLKANRYFGGIMLWDASYDENNIIGGRHYSSIIKEFMKMEIIKIICSWPSGSISIVTIILYIFFTVIFIATIISLTTMLKKRKQKTTGSEQKIQQNKKYLMLQIAS